MQSPDESFEPAPAGTRVRVMTIVVAGVIAACVAASALFVPRDDAGAWRMAILAPLAGPPIVVAVAWFSRIRALRLIGMDLVVVRTGWPVRFSLEGLASVQPDRSPLAGARKLAGNDGLGAISGRFRSERFGQFRVYLSDPERGVVVRSAAGTIAVSPAQPSVFVDALKRRAGRSAT